MGETVFATYSALARATNAINLGQGFPDDAPDGAVLEALRAGADGHQQYAPMPGDPNLTGAIARALGGALARDLDPLANVQVTVGATEGLFASVQALVDPGDEVVIVEPWYDAYPEMVRMAGGRVVGVPMRLEGARWRLDRAALTAAVGPRTRLVMVNTPHNPTGAVYDDDDLDAIVAAAARADAVVLSDEVYEHLAFVPFTRLASRPGAWERTLTVSSIGKSFGVTGWKVGWVSGPDDLVGAVRAAHQWIPFAVATPLQRACATLLEGVASDGGASFARLRASLERRRDLLTAVLTDTGFTAHHADGGYFVVADATALGFGDGEALARALPAAAGVVAIPMRAFVSGEHCALVDGMLRFAFCKGDDAIAEAGVRLRAWRDRGFAAA
ncbi:MAG: aminotransferase class I/II-fold pyridoxal phosphate-dependent enzyme [Trueperaceae bacterium]|nr:aminotransferase class I/II-fold pyridoxal phosphate-dependent enzyme [Trueperaceae bacterium]